MRQVIDLERWPLHELDSVGGQELVTQCRNELRDSGMFSLGALVRPNALEACVSEIESLFDSAAFTQSRDHNVYFDGGIRDLEADHPALRRFVTVNRTICGDSRPA